MKFKKLGSEWLIVIGSGKIRFFCTPWRKRYSKCSIMVDGQQVVEHLTEYDCFGFAWQRYLFTETDGTPVAHWIEDKLDEDRREYYRNLVCQKVG